MTAIFNRNYSLTFECNATTPVSILTSNVTNLLLSGDINMNMNVREWVVEVIIIPLNRI